MKRVGFQTKLPLALLAFFTSLVMFVVVRSQSAPPQGPGYFSIPVSIEGLPEGYIATQYQHTISAYAEGSPEELSRVDVSQLKAVVDFAKIDPDKIQVGESSPYPVALVQSGSMPVRPRLASASIRVQVEKIIRRLLPVSIETRGQLSPAQNLLFNGAIAEPENITLVGPASEVEKVQKVRALLSLEDVAPNKPVTVTLEALEDSNKPASSMVTVEPKTVMVRSALSAAQEKKPVLVSPEFVGQSAFGFNIKRYEVDPSQVFITGESSLLAGISAIQTKPINLEGIQETSTFDAELQLPDGVRLVKAYSVKVRVIVVPAPPGAPPVSNSPNQ